MPKKKKQITPEPDPKIRKWEVWFENRCWEMGFEKVHSSELAGGDWVVIPVDGQIRVASVRMVGGTAWAWIDAETGWAQIWRAKYWAMLAEEEEEPSWVEKMLDRWLDWAKPRLDRLRSNLSQNARV